MMTQEQVVSEPKPAVAASRAGASSAAVIILHGSEKTRSEINAAKLVEFMGGEVTFMRIPESAISDAASLIPQGATVIARAGALAAALPRNVTTADWIGLLTNNAGHCLLFGFESGAASECLLQELTGGSFRTMEKLPSGDCEFAVAAEHRDVCRQFSGLVFKTAVRASDTAFVRSDGQTTCQELIRIGGKPSLIAVERGDVKLLLSAGSEVADLDESPEGRAPMDGFFSRLAPLLMFLRRACSERLWHNDSPRACLIVDDPLLKPRYGFIEFEKLLVQMQCERFSTSIAFIPWNHRRSDARVAELFKRFPTHLSLCVHGCDHTGAEFASTDIGFLRSQATKGLQWMMKHRELTGVGFDDVMVFPQGHFSTAAIKALQSCGYLAAVNSTGCPVDVGAESLQLRDLLDVAVTKFHGFPLFVRHYPSDVVGLAVDLFLGKPAFLVEHHAYFRNGYEPLVEIVRTLHEMEPRLKWANPYAICSQACLQHQAANGEREVRFYTDRFVLRNNTSEMCRYVLLQKQDAEFLPVAITVNDVAAESVRRGDDLLVKIELKAGQTAKIQVRRPETAKVREGIESKPLRRASVFVRRHLSEFRDNHVDRNLFLSRMASSVRNCLVKKK